MTQYFLQKHHTSGHAQYSCVLRKRAEEHVTTQLISSALVLWEVFIALTRISKIPDGLKKTHTTKHMLLQHVIRLLQPKEVSLQGHWASLSGEERPPFKRETDRTCLDFRDAIWRLFSQSIEHAACNSPPRTAQGPFVPEREAKRPATLDTQEVIA